MKVFTAALALSLFTNGSVFAEAAGSASPPVEQSSAEQVLEDVMKPIDEVLHAAAAELADEAGESSPAIPPGDTLLQAFLVEPPMIEPIGLARPASCTATREERRRMRLYLGEMRLMRQEAERRLRAFRKSGGKNEALRERLDESLGKLGQRAELLRAYYEKVNQAEPDRSYTYHLRLHGSRARSLEAFYETSPEVQLLRVRFGRRGWKEFPTEAYAVHEGLQGPPELGADGVTWTLRRHLTAYQACTKNLGFALEYLTRWRPRPGTPAVAERGVTVRTHAWVYGR